MTLTGTILLNDGVTPLPFFGYVRFWPIVYPVAVGTDVHSGGVWEVQTDEQDGTFEIELPAGQYRVEWRVRAIVNRGFINLTTNSDLSDILSSTLDGAVSTPTTGEFATVALMIASNSALWTFARCYNFNTGDGVYSEWSKTSDPDFVANNVDKRTTTDGAKIIRTFVREDL